MNLGIIAKDIFWGVVFRFEGFSANLIATVREHYALSKCAPKCPIDKEFKKAYYEYWKNYPKIKRDVKFAWRFAAKNGNFDPRYIPNTFYFTVIDTFYNDRRLVVGFNDKNYYDKIFANFLQPKTIVRKINGKFLDADYNLISEEKAFELISNQNEVICKPSLETGCGEGIFFFSPQKDSEKIKAFLSDSKKSNYIVQLTIQQHAELNKLHSHSVNTIRICSILLDDGVHVLSSCLRIGMGDARVDNLCAGGICVGISSSGYLNEYAYSSCGDKLKTHPCGLVFSEFKIPGYDKAVELVKNAHPSIARFRLVSWDIAIDENSNPVLIEANMNNGGINIHQTSNGPLFGDLTERVIAEVTKREKF